MNINPNDLKAYHDMEVRAGCLLADPVRKLFDMETIPRNDPNRTYRAAMFMQRQPHGAVIEAEEVGHRYLLRSYWREK